MVLKVKIRDFLRDFRKYREKLESGEVDKVIIESVRIGDPLELSIAHKYANKTSAQQALDYCKNLEKPLQIKSVKLNIFDNFLK